MLFLRRSVMFCFILRFDMSGLTSMPEAPSKKMIVKLQFRHAMHFQKIEG